MGWSNPSEVQYYFTYFYKINQINTRDLKKKKKKWNNL